MKKSIVIYKSKYGSTKRYAEWISNKLDADLFEVSKVKKETLSQYETIIFGGALYAGGINGISFIRKNFEILKEKKLIVFVVGVSPVENKKDLEEVINKNFTPEMQGCIQVGYLRGALDYTKLSFKHRVMMWGLKQFLSKQKELTEDQRVVLDTYGKTMNFIDQESIQSVIRLI